MSQRITCDPITKKPNEVLRINVDFTLYGLDTSELLTGTPVVAEVETTDLTLGNKSVNTSTFLNRRGKTVAVGKGVQFTVSGGVAGTDYEITIQCGTTGSPAQTLEVTAPLEVRDDD